MKENGFAALVPIFEKEEMTEWSLFKSVNIDVLRKMNISMGQSIRLAEALKGMNCVSTLHRLMNFLRTLPRGCQN